MKKFLFFTLLLFCSYIGYTQVYIPMPANSAVWRYRMYNVDYVTQVNDCIIFVNGTDTIAPIAIGGNTYNKLISRSCLRVVPNGYIPPMVDTTATIGDTYYGAIRESGKQVFQLTLSGEQLMFDYNAAVGDSIPAYSGKDRVTVIDSVLLSGVYHRRFLTNDSTYYVIEGIGSNRGLIPDINDGSGNVQFICFTYAPMTYSPDTTVPCTYVYHVGYVSAVYNINEQDPEIKVFPVPAGDVLHITSSGNSTLNVTALNNIGQVIWTGDINKEQDIPIITWPKGMYYVEITGGITGRIIKKIIVQ
jgi:hypothetical protein